MVLFKKRPAASGSLFMVLFKIRPAASGSLFRVLFKVRPAESGSGFRVFLKNVQGIIQRIIQNTTCSVWFRIQRIIQKYAGYYSASGSRFSVLFKIRPAASVSGYY